MRAGGLDEDRLFAYIYALLHSSVYRTRYADFLMIDYPRVPVTANAQVFQVFAHLGSQLLAVHLLRQPLPESDADASMTIGGYQLPRKFIGDRANPRPDIR